LALLISSTALVVTSVAAASVDHRARPEGGGSPVTQARGSAHTARRSRHARRHPGGHAARGHAL